MTLVVSGNPDCMLTGATSSGRVVACAYEEKRHGWQVTVQGMRSFAQIYVESQADARLVLKGIGEALGDE